jgi:MFS family permease
VTAAGARPDVEAAPRPPLALIFSITLTGILANTLVNAPLPDILEAFEQPDSAAGFFVSAGALPGIVMAPVIGLLADRYGRRRVLVPCLLSFGVFGLLGAVSPSWGVLLLLRLGQGIGAAGLINLAVVLIGDFWAGIDRARVIGYNAAVLTVSLAIVPALGGFLAEFGSWRWSFLPYGTALVTGVAVLLLLPADHAGRDRGAGFFAQLRQAGTVLRRPVVATTVVYGFVLFLLIFGLFLTVLPILLADRFGLSAGARGLVLAAPAAASTLVALNLARLRPRFGAGRLVIGATALFGAGFALIGLAGAVALVLVGAALYGLGEGMSIPTLQDLVAGEAPDESRGAVVAVWVSAVRAGQAVGPLVAGACLASIGGGTTFVLAAAVVGIAAVALARSPLRSAP